MKPKRLGIPGGLVLAMVVGFLAQASAQEETPERIPGIAEKVSGFAVLDRSAVPAGGAFRIAIDLEVEFGWYIYGNPLGPGIGKPTEVNVKAPDGIDVGPALYLPATKHDQSELGPGQWVWAYEDQTRIYLKGRIQPDLAPGKREVKLTVDCLACEAQCVEEQLELSVTVNVVPAGETVETRFAALFKDFNAAKSADGKPAKAASDSAPTPESPRPIQSAPPGPESGPEVLNEATEVAIAEYAPRVKETDHGLLLWLLFGFVAGMILNVMPCVLPVISIKILSLVQQAKEDRKTVFAHGLVFSAGILAVFLILAFAAANAGHSWGEHFQSSTFLVAMIIVIFLFSLGLFDVYTIEVPGFVTRQGGQTREGLGGSFLKGMLATLLATPCSGPFLGGTLAYALSKPPEIIFAIFASIGLGMAIPYVILTAHPAFLRFVPKPGPWMVRFKELMGFVLLGTVVYLLGIVSNELRIWVIGVCLILGLASWIFGRVTGPERSLTHRMFWRTVAIVIAVGLSYWTHGLLVVGSHLLEKEPFNFARLQTLGQEGRTVMVDWTADWCPNCKYVEKAVLESEEVRQAMKRKDVVFMVADITQKRPVEEALMNRLGSKAIPFLGVFPGDDPKQVHTLRDIYSIDDVLDILNDCPDPASRKLTVSRRPVSQSNNQE
jgi:thiol:disulfide interchange protein DsbD